MVDARNAWTGHRRFPPDARGRGRWLVPSPIRPHDPLGSALEGVALPDEVALFIASQCNSNIRELERR